MVVKILLLFIVYIVNILMVYIYSIRILPHHQDTGGFFVTVLEKIKPLPWESPVKQTDVETDKAVGAVDFKDNRRKQKKRRYQGYREDPFVFLSDDDPVWPEIKYYFKL